MKKIVELPLATPVFSTYHKQAIGAAIAVSNPSVRNWYINNSVVLTCTRDFLTGFTTPKLEIKNTRWVENPHLSKLWFSTRYLDGCVNKLICNLLDDGYYVCFDKVDDYYVEGKSWYGKRHFSHDGMICGYNQNDKTFCLYAYDENWRYQKFWTSQKSFEKGRKVMFKKQEFGDICAIKPCNYIVRFYTEKIFEHLDEYLDSNIAKYPFDGDGEVCGIVVHTYLAKYVEKLIDGSIPYEKMDWRVFRLVWEHKLTMYERLQKLEDVLKLSKDICTEYEKIVDLSNRMRMLYAAHHMRRKDSVLPIIRDNLILIEQKEREILEDYINKWKESR